MRYLNGIKSEAEVCSSLLHSYECIGQGHFALEFGVTTRILTSFVCLHLPTLKLYYIIRSFLFISCKGREVDNSCLV